MADIGDIREYEARYGSTPAHYIGEIMTSAPVILAASGAPLPDEIESEAPNAVAWWRQTDLKGQPNGRWNWTFMQPVDAEGNPIPPRKVEGR